MPQKEHFGTFKNSILFPENQLQMEHHKLLMYQYALDSQKRLAVLKEKNTAWWEEEVAFFETRRTRAWVMLRRIAHTAHHRGEQTVLLRLFGRTVYSIYGASASTGGLPIHGATTIYAYQNIDSLIDGEIKGGLKAPLPGPGDKPCTERPD